MKTYIVTGCSSGLGAAICKVLGECNFVVGLDIIVPDAHVDHYIRCDLQDPEQVTFAAAECQGYHIVGLINCAGINEINMLEDLTLDNWNRVMNLNARAIYLTARAFLPELIATKGTILNIVSNAAHMPMTASLAYNASKGAAHIMTLQLARELTRRHNITVFGVAPNKMTGTEMSRYIDSRVPEVRGWTREQADDYQRQSLLTGEETPPEVVANFIGYLLSSSRNHRFLSGCVIPYGA